MKIFWKLVFIWIILFCVSFSQSKNDTSLIKQEFFVKGIINKNLSNYQLKVQNIDLYVNNDYRYTLYNFIILDTLKSDTLSISSMEKINGLVKEIYNLTDINFDGYNDLKVLVAGKV